jgi:hypothetical protein
MPRRAWTEGEVKRANDMRAAGYSYGTIDKVLGRHSGATQQRLEIAGHGSRHDVRSNRIPAELLAERDALAAARGLRALTQNFCGDPPPGYSALHGKTGLRSRGHRSAHFSLNMRPQAAPRTPERSR